ncbi:peptidase C39 [Rossellomorea marisflavi]|uniref:peptidase domain-containing ABC transporter n=1 Tax=Rossellomorea marisflavi TaxID=189381 RepID=UPI0025C832DC|nr:peptidase domain-containing ABC transporter [Rossellomorea marisflavi]GLI84825.1 peptidase C39 [Rossellomorea marisflavi]
MFKKRTPFIEQMQQTECGLSCIAMVSGYYNGHYSLNELREFSEAGREGLNLLSLRNLARDIGFDARVLKTDSCAEEELKHFKLPAILFFDANHYVVLEKVHKNYFQIIDPGYGRKKLNYKEFESKFQNIIIELRPNEEFTPKKKPPVWKDYLKHLKEKPSLITGILVTALILQLSMLLIPILIQYLIDHILLEGNRNVLFWFMTGIVSLMIIQGGFQYFRGQLLIKLNVLLDQRLMGKFFSHILRLPLKYFQTRSFGDILFRASSLRVIRDMMSTQLVMGVLNIGSVIFIFIYMMVKSPILATTVVGLALLSVIFTILNSAKLKEKNTEEVSMNSQMQGYQTEILYGISSVKVSGLEKEVYSKWEGHLDNIIRTYRKKEGFLNYINSINGVMQTVFPLIILWVGAFQVFNGSITIGGLVAFHSLCGQFFSSSNTLIHTYNSINITTSYLMRVSDVLKSKIEPNGDVNIKLKGGVRLEDVSFSYEKQGPAILKNINLDINPGDKVAIIGGSGAGKSTLASLILGLYQPLSGNVYFDDINMKNLDLSNLRKQIGVVPQNVSLFNQTIKDNITLGNNQVSQEDLLRAIQMANIGEDISRMAMGINTMVSEMGMNLSGGQRQRVALARSLLNKPTIMLLDEATSSLDHNNENKIDQYLEDLNCTRIIITHNLASITDADLIIEVKDGIIINEGNHESMIIKSDFYQSFHQNNTKYPVPNA